MKAIFRALCLAAVIAFWGGCAVDDGSGTEVGSEGGTVVSEGKAVSIEIPAGALDESVNIEIHENASAPEGHIGPAWEFLPDGQKFLKPITIAVTYSSTDLPSDVDESDLRLATVVDSTWTRLDGSEVDTSANTVTATTDHFSTYGLIVDSAVSGCRTDNECPAGQDCVNGECMPGGDGCRSSLECGPGEDCESGDCVPIDGGTDGGDGGTDSGTDSGSDAGDGGSDGGTDSGTDGAVDSGVDGGADGGDTGYYCSSDRECAPGQVCVNGYCVVADGGTDGGTDTGEDGGTDSGTDSGSDGGAFCSSDLDCAAGQSCLNGYCVADDAGSDGGTDGGTDGAVDSGVDGGTDVGPDAGSCSSDSDCAAGQICSNGVCVAAQRCTSNRDCLAPQLCIANICR
ncbi:MAG: hypothetical protein HY897_01090 [Deltaproteobacteria bacterium]|nr:hypothetical protein [Deltaproteobacteria bacterium]